jgi:hypothetical protein
MIDVDGMFVVRSVIMRRGKHHLERLTLLIGLLVSLTTTGTAQVTPAGTTPSACVAVTGPDVADSTAPRPTPAPALRDSAPAAIRLLATVTASEVRFVGSPKVCVQLTGDARLDSAHVLARRNLSSPVVSGTTYRNVYIAVEVVGRIDAECIANRITGQRADTTAIARCGSLNARTGSGARPP